MSKGERIGVILILVAASSTLLLLLLGCSPVREADRNLNWQSRKAGEFIAAQASDPEVAQAGRDVSENCATLEATLLGAPAVPAPYSPEASATARKRSAEEHRGGGIPWGSISMTVLGLASGAAGASLLGRTTAAALRAVVEGVARIRERAAANGGQIQIKDALDELAKAQSDPRVREVVRAIAHEKEAELAAKL